MKKKQKDKEDVRPVSADDLEKRREQIRRLRGSLSPKEAANLRANVAKIRRRSR